MDTHQKVLRVPDGVFLSVGLTWSFYGKAPADLDISAVCFAKGGRFLDVVFFNHPMASTAVDPVLLRRQYVLEAHELPYMFLGGDSRTGGEDENRVMTLAEKERRPQSASPLFYNMATAEGGHRQHNKVHDKIMADTAHIFDRLYERETFGRYAFAAGMFRSRLRAPAAAGAAASRRRRLSDESIIFNMGGIPAEAEYIFICVTSYSGVDFSRLPTVKLDIMDETHHQRVETLDLQHATGDGTANLSACLMRVPSPTPAVVGGPHAALPPFHTNLWDLRELNIRSMGYTFVDLLPGMLHLLGVPTATHADVMRGVPNYSLMKQNPWAADADGERPTAADTSDLQEPSGLSPRSAGQRAEPEDLLADLRFGVGWEGDHDIDAFLLLLDDSQEHVAHLHPKVSRTISSAARRHLACQHSGDCRCGGTHSGDAESIDMLAYALPPEAHTLLVGASLVNSHHSAGASASPVLMHQPQSIVEVPGLYLRLQNRTLNNPYTTEVDRWDVYRDKSRFDAAHGVPRRFRKGKTAAPAPQDDEESADTDGTESWRSTAEATIGDALAAHTRTVVLGALVRVGEVPVQELFPEGRSVSEALSLSPTPREAASAHGRPPTAPTGAGADLDAAALALTTERQVQLLRQTLVPRFAYVPLRQLVPVDPLHASFSGVVAYLQGLATVIAGEMAGGSPRLRAPSTRCLLSAIRRAELNKTYGLLLEFVEVVELRPRLPDQFRCHAEAWVHGAGPECNLLERVYRNNNLLVRSAKDSRRGLEPPNLPFQTSHLTSEEHLNWDSGNAAYFLVHPYDRIRLTLYSRAAFGVTDLCILDHPDVFSTRTQRQHAQNTDASVSASASPRSVSSRLPATTTKDLTLELDCGVPESLEDEITAAPRAVLQVRISRVSADVCRQHLASQAAGQAEARHRHRLAKERQFNETQRKRMNWCTPM